MWTSPWRATTAMNPEDLALMAYAVLRYAHSDEPLGEIVPAVEALIDEHLAAHRRLHDAQAATRRDQGESPHDLDDGSEVTAE
jgi:hypothetical protein